MHTTLVNFISIKYKYSYSQGSPVTYISGGDLREQLKVVLLEQGEIIVAPNFITLVQVLSVMNNKGTSHKPSRFEMLMFIGTCIDIFCVIAIYHMN